MAMLVITRGYLQKMRIQTDSTRKNEDKIYQGLVKVQPHGPGGNIRPDFTRSSSARLGYNSHHLDEPSNQMIQSVKPMISFQKILGIYIYIFDWLINIY
jgi:hypothetical protein